MWHSMFATGIPVAEKAIRTVVVYLGLGLLLRLGGKRELAQLTGFDLVVMLLLSNVVQNAVIGPDNSLSGGLLGAAILIAANAVMVRLADVQPWMGWWFNGTPTVLARDGSYDRRALRRLALRPASVDQAILEQGGETVADTELVTLEPGGAVLVRLRTQEQNATHSDTQALRAQLDRIEQLLRDQRR
jgi:uncharacterized membrane protein YcaP (DUF421 family)